MSVNAGDTVSFKIKTTRRAYHIDILRLGYYQGNGARKVAASLTPTATLPQTQPACLTDADHRADRLRQLGGLGLVDRAVAPRCRASTSRTCVRDDTGGDSQIVFVVRDDASHSDMLVQTSDATWQAYNTYGGNSLYTVHRRLPARQPGGLQGRVKVSYNRPFHTPRTTAGAAG